MTQIFLLSLEGQDFTQVDHSACSDFPEFFFRLGCSLMNIGFNFGDVSMNFEPLLKESQWAMKNGRNIFKNSMPGVYLSEPECPQKKENGLR